MNASVWVSMVASGALVACANAGPAGGGDNTDAGFIHVTDGPTRHDSPSGGPDSPTEPDAPRVDSPSTPMNVTMQETNDDNVTALASIACSNMDDGSTTDNVWYRAFQLSDFGISTGVNITAVHFGVEVSTGVTVEVDIGTFTGAVGGETLDLSTYHSLATVNQTVNSTNEQSVPVNVTIPAGGKFVVEVAAPDESGVGQFYLGCTTGAEQDPGYLTTNSCPGATTPTDVIELGGGGGPILYVTGTTL
ncbi:MAG TPA: hypothetical protein VGM88_19180 [Kofleriaceae bacterium]